MTNLHEQERLLYQARLRAMRDEASRKAEWEQIARERAQQGFEKGFEKGKVIALSEFLARWMNKKFGSRSLPFLPLLNRIEKEAELIQLQDQLDTDISFEEFVAQLEKGG